MKKFLVIAVLAVLAVWAFAAPQSEPEDNASAPESSASEAPASKVEVRKNAKYDLPDDAIDAAVSGGYDCGERINQTSLNYFITECENGGFFTTYDDDAERDEWLEGTASYGTWADGDGSAILVGPNWTVQCDEVDTCRELQGILGGKPALSE